MDIHPVEPVIPPEEKLTKPERAGRGALFIPAGLCIGFGLGYASNNIVTGTCIGLGVGFVLLAISLFFRK